MAPQQAANAYIYGLHEQQGKVNAHHWPQRLWHYPKKPPESMKLHNSWACQSALNSALPRNPEDSILMQVVCFGLGLVKLDVRQESTEHSNAVSFITEYLGLGTYRCALDPGEWHSSIQPCQSVEVLLYKHSRDTQLHNAFGASCG